MSDLDKSEDRRIALHTAITWWGALAAAATILLVYGFWFGYFNGLSVDGIDPASWGQFGDFVGGVLNPFVSFCALFWLTRSIRIQKDELSATKSELAEARVAQQNQAVTLEKQRFEDTFFSLLNQHNSLLERITSPDSNRTGMLSDGESFHNRAFGLTIAEAKIHLEECDREFGHYFRLLYQLLKLVALKCPGSCISPSFLSDEILNTPLGVDEKFYTNIIRSFIDVDTAQLLAVNCFSEPGGSFWRYKCLVERYALLEHMPFERSGVKYHLLHEAYVYYNKNAFGDSDYVKTLQ